VSGVVEANPSMEGLVRAEIERRIAEGLAAQRHPADWMKHTMAVDPKTGEEFYFHFNEGWEWQRDELTSYLHEQVILRLKARQLGVSWLGIGYCEWKCLTSPGTRALAVSTGESESSKLINRAWDLWENSPDHMRFDAEVIKPTKGRPATQIQWRFPDGRISSLLAMPSSARAGHGETAGVVFLDEFGRHPYADESWKAFIPVIADGGQLLIVSTANGFGNAFYDLWTNADDRGIEARFLGADKHPGRDINWFAMIRKTLSTADMAEQYPLNAAEAFLGTAGCWFDVDALGRYAEKVIEPKYRMDFIASDNGAKAQVVKRGEGLIHVYEQPIKGREYAIYADVATGRGKDYSDAVVIDLSNMNIVAELHGKIDPDLFAEQLHYLGRWYHTARIAIEMGGGFGEPVVISLRDGRHGRRPYPKLYRHVQDDRPDYKQNITYGFPVTTKTRPLIINALEVAIREEALPHIPMDTILECKTFVRRDTLPSPRAADGCNDDRVMALAGALEMYRRYGSHPLDVRTSRKRKKREYVHDYAWS
jgi:hypothetical protein